MSATSRSNALAERLEKGAQALAALASSLTPEQWQARIPHDNRKVGVVVHHVASVYPIEIQLAQGLGKGEPMKGVTWDGINEMNAGHAKDNDGATKEETIALLKRNSANAAAAIRKLTDAELDSAATASLYDDAPLTCQFFLEDHAVRHSYHHLGRIKAALGLG